MIFYLFIFLKTET